MKGLIKAGVDAWNAKVDEVIKAVPVSEEEAKRIRSMYPRMTKKDIDDLLREYRSPSHKEKCRV